MIGHLDYIFFNIIKKATVTISRHMALCLCYNISLEEIPRSIITGLKGV